MSVNGTIIRVNAEELAWLKTASDDEVGEKTDDWFWSDNPRSCELEKMYAGVHFLLIGMDAGGEGPLSFIGNQSYGEELAYEFAYGPGRVFPPEVVREIDKALCDLPSSTITKRLNDPALDQVYPFSMRSVSAEDKKWLKEALDLVRNHVHAAVGAGDGLLIAIL